ncbi:putative aladin [Apostichopus japonicus]|uniref:Putative aladin n=1 Tax=Stichopus japonicus TaxID=307972 RepID=A0A2G8L0S8_STIJA|nr:putative aladin [Apostichopus japonicus]
MCSLQESLPPPALGIVTVAEQNGDLITRPEDEATTLIGNSLQGINLPIIEASTDTLASLAIDESAQSAFLPNKGDIPLWKRAWYSCNENGVSGMLEEMAEERSDVPWLVSSMAYGCLTAVRAASTLQGSIYPHMTLSRPELISEYSVVRDWDDSEIRAFAWHPHTNKCAVAWQNDSIKRHCAHLKASIPTWCLLFGLETILCWNLSCWLSVLCPGLASRPASQSTRPSAGSAQVLSHHTNCPITTLAWDPRGRLLTSASPWDTVMMVWNVPRETSYAVGRGGGGGVSLLRWSPDKSRLLAATPSAVFRVWETHSWTCEKWTQLSGRLQAACWSPDSQILLFCSAKEPAIYSLNFNATKVGGATTGGAQAAVKCADLSEVIYEDGDLEGVRIGGLIQDMAWDPTGERLAVLFQKTLEEDHADDVIALFNTRLQPVLELIPCGFIRCEPEEEPQLISFLPKFDKGALLTICFKSGKVKFLPLIFTSVWSLSENRRPPFQALNGSSHHRNLELFSVND